MFAATTRCESLCLRLQVFLKWNAVYKFRLSHQQCSRLFINTKLSCDTVSGSAVKVGFTARPLSTPRLSEKSRGASGNLKSCLQDSMDDCFSRPKEPLCSIFILIFLLNFEFGVKHEFSTLYKTRRHPTRYVCQPRLGMRPHSPARESIIIGLRPKTDDALFISPSHTPKELLVTNQILSWHQFC